MLEDYIKKELRKVMALSKCEKRKVACLIYNKELGAIISGGYNENTIADTPCEDSDGFTYDTVIHAEIAAIQSVGEGFPKEDLVAYVSHDPCAMCYSTLVDTVSEVIVYPLSKKWDKEPKPIKVDAVHPSHYADVSGVPSIEFFKASSSIEQWRGYCKNTAMKYLYRLNGKEDPTINAKKCQYFVNKLVESYNENNS